jgi:hypothetical protein
METAEFAYSRHSTMIVWFFRASTASTRSAFGIGCMFEKFAPPVLGHMALDNLCMFLKLPFWLY